MSRALLFSVSLVTTVVADADAAAKSSDRGAQPSAAQEDPTPWVMFLGRVVRIELASGSIAEGEVLQVDDASVELRTGAGVTRVLRIEIRRVHQLDGLDGHSGAVSPPDVEPVVEGNLDEQNPESERATRRRRLFFEGMDLVLRISLGGGGVPVSGAPEDDDPSGRHRNQYVAGVAPGLTLNFAPAIFEYFGFDTQLQVQGVAAQGGALDVGLGGLGWVGWTHIGFAVSYATHWRCAWLKDREGYVGSTAFPLEHAVRVADGARFDVVRFGPHGHVPGDFHYFVGAVWSRANFQDLSSGSERNKSWGFGGDFWIARGSGIGWGMNFLTLFDHPRVGGGSDAASDARRSSQPSILVLGGVSIVFSWLN